ncbi:unnamed protein product [Ixodes pacificus]
MRPKTVSEIRRQIGGKGLLCTGEKLCYTRPGSGVPDLLRPPYCSSSTSARGGRIRHFKRVGPAPISGERRGPLETAGRLETTREAAENRSPNNRPRKECEATAIPKVLQCRDHSDKKRKKRGNQLVRLLCLRTSR